MQEVPDLEVRFVSGVMFPWKIVKVNSNGELEGLGQFGHKLEVKNSYWAFCGRIPPFEIWCDLDKV